MNQSQASTPARDSWRRICNLLKDQLDEPVLEALYAAGQRLKNDPMQNEAIAQLARRVRYSTMKSAPGHAPLPYHLFSNRVCNKLRSYMGPQLPHGIQSWEQLPSPQKLMKIRNFGAGCLSEIEEVAASIGIYWNEKTGWSE